MRANAWRKLVFFTIIFSIIVIFHDLVFFSLPIPLWDSDQLVADAPHAEATTPSLQFVLQESKAACPAPVVDAENEISMRFLRKILFKCPHQQPLTTLAKKGSLSFNHKLASKMNLTCVYSFFKRGASDERMNVYEKAKRLEANQTIKFNATKNLLNITCLNQMNNSAYINTHMFIPKLASSHVTSASKPNVLVIFVESLSTLAYKRLMRKTAARMGANGFLAMNNFIKSGENSFPNMIAFLTGRTLDKKMEESTKRNYFDTQYKYLWKDFKENGYITGFMKDLPHMGRKGFYKQPTDFYPQAFWTQMYPDPKSWRNEYHNSKQVDFCFDKNGPKVDLFLDHIIEFVKKNRKHPYFLMATHSQMTHQNINYFEVIDKPYDRFFKQIEKLSENTIIMLAGDHGFRMGSYVTTSVGRLEERLTLVSILVHESIHTQYPHLRAKLMQNRNTLMSWYDIHIMMKSIADGSFREANAVETDSKFFNPLTQVIPTSRTCADAGIPVQHCVCGNGVNVNPYTRGAKSDIVSVYKAADTFWRQTCNQTVTKLVSMHYDIPVEESVLLEHVVACFEVKKHKEEKCLEFVRDLRKPKAEFVIHSDDTTNQNPCIH